MYRNKNENLKILLLIIVILILPFLFIAVEAIHKIKIVSEIDPAETFSNTLDELYNKITEKPKNTDASDIRKALIAIFNLMNEEKFDELYTLLTDDMKKNMFADKEEFINYMKIYLEDKKYSPSFSNYSKLTTENTNIFIINTSFLPYSTEENLDASLVAEKNDIFLLHFDNNKNYKYSFSSYLGTKEYNNIYEKENLRFNVIATHLYTSKTEYEIEITNKSDSEQLFISNEGIIAFTGVIPNYYPTSIFIPPNTTQKIKLTIYTGLSLKNTLPTELYFYNVFSGEKFYAFTIPVEYPVNISY